VLPAGAVRQLAKSLEASRRNEQHVWRDHAPMNADGTVNAYIEIPRGDLQKWEFDMGANRRAIDRMIPPEVGGYPVNYGFVPQTVSYDGDPFDALVLGPPIAGGELVRGVSVGLLDMTDEKGADAKVVLAPLDRNGRATLTLTATDREIMGRYFDEYKRAERDRFARFNGWGSAEEGLAHVRMTHAFFLQCRPSAGTASRQPSTPLTTCRAAAPGRP
jgi:inorganic pyrophosphatase